MHNEITYRNLSPTDILKKYSSIKSEISTALPVIERYQEATLNRQKGMGTCGIMSEPKSMISILKRATNPTSTALWGDYMVHIRVIENHENLSINISFPRCHFCRQPLQLGMVESTLRTVSRKGKIECPETKNEWKGLKSAPDPVRAGQNFYLKSSEKVKKAVKGLVFYRIGR